MTKYYIITVIKYKHRYYLSRRCKLTRFPKYAARFKHHLTAKIIAKIATWGLGDKYTVCEIETKGA